MFKVKEFEKDDVDRVIAFERELRKQEPDTALQMVLMPVSVSTGSSSAGTAITSVKQQQTMSATQIKSASNGMNLKMVYSGFSIDYDYEFSEGF